MNRKQIVGFVAAVVLGLCFAGQAIAEEEKNNGWLVKTKNPSSTGQWILREDGSTELKTLPPGLQGRISPSEIPPGFERGRKEGWERGSGKGSKGERRLPPGFVDTRVYGDGKSRTPPGFVDTRVYGDGKRRTPPGFVDTRVYGDGTPRTPPGFVDTRTYGNGQRNQGHLRGAAHGKDHRPEMLDPYGHAKDDRKDLSGNRGRVGALR